MIVSRFAPSPTGRLHLGHAYSAVLAHDFARARGGRFLLRIEDIDHGRSREEHVAAILADLTWLGLRWDGSVERQSQRLAHYAEALGRLRREGLVYPCFCTRSQVAAEIAASAAAPHGNDGPLYPGSCRALEPVLRERGLGDEPHSWRLDVVKAAALAGALHWQDSAAGTVAARPERHGDVILARKDAPVSYHLAVTVDDAAQGVTDVVRGRDLLAVTDVHRLLQALLGLPTPRYHHHALLADGSGRRLAKRAGSPALAELRAGGADPAGLLAGLRRGEIPIGFTLSTS
ncbi:MAG: tRNA glutamyl-Q(34) synthetase GluQRS [Pseudolabrys sp.]|nr:tRNA glutamyl-Q(34) synthetase GluQRS [Pseudolabrys sp.]